MHGARDGRLRWRGQSKVEPIAGNNDTYKSRFEKGFADGLSGYVEQTHVVFFFVSVVVMMMMCDDGCL